MNQNFHEIFGALHFYKFTFKLKVTDTIVFPYPFKGLLFRNAIKNVFVKEFEPSVVKEIFESEVSKEKADLLKIGSYPPRGYIIEDDTQPKLKYQPGDYIYFNLFLIGNSIKYIDLFISAVVFLGKKYWLGRKSGYGHGKFILEEVLNNDKNIYDRLKEKLYISNFTKTTLETLEHRNKYKRILLNFISPTCIVPEYDVKPVLLNRTGDMKLFMNMLYKRLVHLQYLYCGEDEFELEQINGFPFKITGSEFTNHKYIIGRKKFEGFTGYLEVGEVPENYIPLFILGEQLHVGKDCSYGFGKYEILN